VGILESTVSGDEDVGFRRGRGRGAESGYSPVRYVCWVEVGGEVGYLPTTQRDPSSAYFPVYVDLFVFLKRLERWSVRAKACSGVGLIGHYT
jgi:hypothetical protein